MSALPLGLRDIQAAYNDAGYTLVELMVGLAVSSIVIAGTYAGYTVFSKQQQLLQLQTEYDRNAMRAIELISADIRVAGYKDYQNPNAMAANQPISILSGTPGDLVLVFDDYDQVGNLYRALIHYYLQPFTPGTGTTRNRLFREWRKCNNPALLCTLGNSSPIYGSSNGEPVLDWVVSFTTQGLYPKLYGSFATQFQAVQIILTVGSGKVIEGTSKSVNSTYSFISRARNVSMVP
jgi:prepilin-type N-terminal cleavage/methylation domain-containing protein